MLGLLASGIAAGDVDPDVMPDFRPENLPQLGAFHAHVLEQDSLALFAREADVGAFTVERLAVDTVLPVPCTIAAGNVRRDHPREKGVERIRLPFEVIVLERDVHMIPVRPAAAWIRLNGSAVVPPPAVPDGVIDFHRIGGRSTSL